MSLNDRDPIDVLRDKACVAEDAVLAAQKALEAAVQKRVAAGAASAVEALRNLVTWVPDCPFALGEGQESPYTGEAITKDDLRHLRDAPFVCEAYTYELFGKEAARSLLARINAVCRALGIEGGYSELQEPWYEAMAAREAEERERHKGVIINYAQAQSLGHTFSKTDACGACPRAEKRCRHWSLPGIARRSQAWLDEHPEDQEA